MIQWIDDFFFGCFVVLIESNEKFPFITAIIYSAVSHPGMHFANMFETRQVLLLLVYCVCRGEQTAIKTWWSEVIEINVNERSNCIICLLVVCNMQFTCEHGVAIVCFVFVVAANDHQWDSNQIENRWSVSNVQNVWCRLPFCVVCMLTFIIQNWNFINQNRQIENQNMVAIKEIAIPIANAQNKQ